ncbi:alpha/beta hydrolase [Mesorhizobium sp. ANAO-SY3R2]|uniref:alpha/beta hydrolase n=1 Tax=Mesorhizobium sp. ANAO-SY3R2 TaxID=3166644 RepID=UPI00366C91C5
MAAYFRNYQTRADLDRAYDVERSVPNFRIYADQWVDGSAQARRHLGGKLGVKYGPTVEEYADIFPAGRRGAPVLIFIHGGYWRMLSAREFSFVALGPVAAGVTTVVANYALCPSVSISEIVRQMRALVAWTYSNIEAFNGDPESIHVCGHSAGGHLTAMMALTDWAKAYGLPANVLKSAFPISGLFELEPLRHSWLQPDLQLDEREVATQSPQRLVRRVSPPMLLSYGSEEPSAFAQQSDNFLAGWKRAGNRASFMPLIGRNHFTAISDFADPQSLFCRELFQMMQHSPSRSLSSGGMTAHERPTAAVSLPTSGYGPSVRGGH